MACDEGYVPGFYSLSPDGGDDEDDCVADVDKAALPVFCLFPVQGSTNPLASSSARFAIHWLNSS